MTDAGPCRKVLAIELPASEVDRQRRDLVGAYARAARIPGFRPGKAPAAMVERHYGKEIAEELKERLLALGYRDALKSQKLKPIAAVDVTDESAVLAGAPFSFKVTLDVPPVFDMPSYQGIPLTVQPVAVTDAQVEETVGQIRERMARHEPVTDRPAALEDMVRIDFEGRCGETPVADRGASCAELGKGQDFWYPLNPATDASFLPGLSAAVVGMAVGETREIPVAFPADYSVAELAGQEARYTVTLREIRCKVLPEMDAAWFQMLGVADEAALRQRIRDDLQAAAERQETARRQDEAARFLLDRVAIEGLPESEVQEETQQIVMNIVRENTLRGIPNDRIKEQRDHILSAAARSSQERVKLTYILDRIAEAEKIEVPEARVEAQLASLAARRRADPVKLRKEMEADGRLDGLRRDLRNAQALAWVVEHATRTDAKQESPSA